MDNTDAMHGVFIVGGFICKLLFERGARSFFVSTCIRLIGKLRELLQYHPMLELGWKTTTRGTSLGFSQILGWAHHSFVPKIWTARQGTLECLGAEGTLSDVRRV
jgi:hypothetical protein